MGDKHARRLNEQATARIGAPVTGAVVVFPRGRQGAALLGPPGLAIHGAMHEATGFAPTNVLALTDDALHAFTAGGALTPKIKEPIGAWSWPDLTAAVSGGMLVRFLSLTWADGTTLELEARVKGANTFQIAVLDEIVARSGGANTTGSG